MIENPHTKEGKKWREIGRIEGFNAAIDAILHSLTLRICLDGGTRIGIKALRKKVPE